MQPEEANIPRYTDKYFVHTRKIIEHFGDCRVTYAIFMRRPVLYACQPAVTWLETVCRMRKTAVSIETDFTEGAPVKANAVMLRVHGSFSTLVELETILLQKLGAACVASYNAFIMAVTLPKVAFIAMDTRHCAGTDMAELMAYAAAVGSAAARRKGAIGFIANTSDATAHYFGQPRGWGSMPHALVGYAGSTVRAAEMFHETFPEDDLIVLVDYFGREITDSIAVAQRFPYLAARGRLTVRIDTHGDRFVEGLNHQRSRMVLAHYAPSALHNSRKTKVEQRYLLGTGVSAAALWHLRRSLDNAGFPRVRLIASSGFSPRKCHAIAVAQSPVDIIGTGSFLPDNWPETYATADVTAYGGIARVKCGREFLFKNEISQKYDT